MEKIDVKHGPERYENIFNMYMLKNSNNDNYYFYNILNKITLPDDLDENIFEYIRVPSNMPLTGMSYNIYGSQYLWWLIMLTNNIKNPVKLLASGSIIKVIKNDYLKIVFDSIGDKI